jgi:uncharacterized protein with NAD-binding domain and iron-sulfur cluster
MERMDVDVCVVGAGYAGLTAARRLTQAGKSVVVLEARDRVGGRIWTFHLPDGSPVDRGGGWLANRHEAILKLASEVGVSTYKTYDDGYHLLIGEGRTRRYRGLIPKISPAAILTIVLAQARLDRMAKRLPVEAPWTAKRAEEWLHNVRVEDGKVAALVWDAGKVKNRCEHIIPLEGRAQEIVQELWKVRRPGCFLFHIEGRPIGQLRTEWARACKAAGFPVGRKTGGLVFHDTRRCAVTNLAAAHVPDVIARSISGHRTPAVHARYNITPEGAKRAALAAADRLVKAGRSG